MDEKVDLAEKLALIDEHFRPKIVAAFNDHEVELVKVKGEFVWHSHAETDDLFVVLAGRITIQLREHNVELGPGELFIVPRGIAHCPRADEEAHVLLIEALGTANTGDAGGARTAPKSASRSTWPGRERGAMTTPGGVRRSPSFGRRWGDALAVTVDHAVHRLRARSPIHPCLALTMSPATCGRLSSCARARLHESPPKVQRVELTIARDPEDRRGSADMKGGEA
jgi:mannose-6-phosphate isomerase-like protein (cupin superfamily)